MIYVKNQEIKESDFVDLLSSTKSSLISGLNDEKLKAIKSSPANFESMVYDVMCDKSINTLFENQIVQTGTFAFPDIIANNYFGVEVKVTIADKWASTGNSILETTRVKGVEKIYMFFGKLGGVVDIKYRPYQDCLYDVGVTHSPRYKIDMLLADGSSIFSKMKIDYDALRQENNPIKRIKEYYKAQLKDGEELWWIDVNADEAPVNPVIRAFSKLEKTEKEKFTVEAFILFPEMLGNSLVKFERAAAYLITSYNAVSSSLRDTFTAGGKAEIKINGKKIFVPRIIFNLHQNSKRIVNEIGNIDQDKLLYYWRTDNLNDRLSYWLDLIDAKSNWTQDGIKASDVFNSGAYEK